MAMKMWCIRTRWVLLTMDADGWASQGGGFPRSSVLTEAGLKSLIPDCPNKKTLLLWELGRPFFQPCSWAIANFHVILSNTKAGMHPQGQHSPRGLWGAPNGTSGWHGIVHGGPRGGCHKERHIEAPAVQQEML